MKPETYITNSAEQTKKIGVKIAKEILKSSPKKIAAVLGLSGNLGSGKTTFLQGFAKGLGVKEKILSPTFVIMKRYKIPKSKNFSNFYHIDCYKIGNAKEVLELGLEEIISAQGGPASGGKNPENIVAIEWPEKIKKILPKNTTLIKFKFIDENTRETCFLFFK